MKDQAWKASPPEEQGRRSLYIFTKRSLLPPLATVFDFPDTTLPCGQRDVTVVAPQALALMNNRFVHDQSEALARLAVSHASGEADRIRFLWKRVLGRLPSPREFAEARTHLRAQADRFRRSASMPPGVTPVSAGKPTAVAEDPLWLALASLSHVLLNTNEFLFVD